MIKASRTTQLGMTSISRAPARAPLTPARLLQFAHKGAALFAAHGAPNTAAVCEAYVQAMAENHHLRRQLASLQEWGDEPTRKSDPETVR